MEGRARWRNGTFDRRSQTNWQVNDSGRVCQVSPIEVKSSGYKAHTSLDTFSEKYSSRIAHKYLVYTKDLKKDGDTLCVPIYMVPLLP